jgi:hypothetical protein
MKTNKVRAVFAAAAATIFSFAGFTNFAQAAVHVAGTNIVSQGTIYMITDDGQRRPYTSAGAYLSYGFNSWANAQPATVEDLVLPQGNFIPPRDGKIVCSDRGGDKGTCYLITNSKRAAFVSAQVFTALGFSFAKALYGDVSFLDSDSNVNSSSEQHRPGVLVNRNGTVYLVSSAGLMGIPSLDVLGSWGYSLSDVVVANDADSSLSQSSVISGRQGAQLSPNQSSVAKPSEASLIQGYLDTYPDLPTATISAPQDAAAVIDLIKQIEAIPGSSLNPIYPYLSSQSIDLLNKAPSLKAYYETDSVFLPAMNQTTTNIQVFQGGTTALYTENKSQAETNYYRPSYWVALKDNGTWKWDLIGTIKYQDQVYKQRNPSDVFVMGSGTNDISIADKSYPDNPAVNDNNVHLGILLKNNGQSTVEKFHLMVRFNTVVVVDEEDQFQLLPGESVIVSAPISYYWGLTGVNKLPGTYATDINVSLGTATEATMSDNSATFNTVFK